MPKLNTEKLNELKKEFKLTNKKIAELTEIGIVTIDTIFSGKNQNPTFNVLIGLAKVFNCKVDDLIIYENNVENTILTNEIKEIINVSKYLPNELLKQFLIIMNMCKTNIYISGDTSLSIEKLNNYKKNKGYTNKQVAELTGISIATIDRLFCGSNTNPNINLLKSIAQLFDCTINDFMNYEINHNKFNISNEQQHLIDASKDLPPEVLKKFTEMIEMYKKD